MSHESGRVRDYLKSLRKKNQKNNFQIPYPMWGWGVVMVCSVTTFNFKLRCFVPVIIPIQLNTSFTIILSTIVHFATFEMLTNVPTP